MSSIRGVAARCGACWWSAVVGRRGARSECTCGTESAPAMANAYFGRGDFGRGWCPGHSLPWGAGRHGRSSRLWSAAKCQGSRVPAPEGTGVATVASPRRAHRPCSRANMPMYPAPVVPRYALRTAHVKCVEHRGKAARCLRYVQYAGGTRPYVQRRPWDVISARPGAKGAESHRPPRVKGRRPRLEERLADDIRSQGQRTGRGNVSCQRRSIDRKEV